MCRKVKLRLRISNLYIALELIYEFSLFVNPRHLHGCCELMNFNTHDVLVPFVWGNTLLLLLFTGHVKYESLIIPMLKNLCRWIQLLLKY